MYNEPLMKGKAKDGCAPMFITLTNKNNMSVTFMDIGATWLSCMVPVKNRKEPREVLLNVGHMEEYYEQTAYFGATIGRYANRIKKGKFTIDGVEHSVTTNHAGNSLHGGEDGTDKRRWKVEGYARNRVVFSIVLPDGDQGFPGEVSLTVTYELSDSNALTMTYVGKTTKRTPINITNHAYFNLAGEKSIFSVLGHNLHVDSNLYLPTDKDGIPTGSLKSVDDGTFDFRATKKISKHYLKDSDQKLVGGYDHAYVLNRTKIGAPDVVLTAPDATLSLEIFTSQPAMQVYTGNFLAGTPNRVRKECNVNDAICLEPQRLPDSPNHPEWPHESCFYGPDDTYTEVTIYKFR